VDLAHISKATMVKFGARVRTWDCHAQHLICAKNSIFWVILSYSNSHFYTYNVGCTYL